MSTVDPSTRFRRPQIAVIGSSEEDGDMMALAEKVGAAIARVGAALTTGGRGGVMAAASKGCAEAGGIVIAITPYTGINEVNAHSHYVIPTGLGWARNVVTAIGGDVIVAIGGAAGTLSEIAYAWMYNRPIVAMSSSGGWAAKMAGQRIDHRRDDVIIDCPSIEQLEPILRRLLDEVLHEKPRGGAESAG